MWLLAALLLAVLTWQVRAATGPLALDLRWTFALDELRSTQLDRLMQLLHRAQGKLLAAAIAGWMAALLWRRQWHALLRFTAAIPGGMLANSAAKLLVARPRPQLVDAMIGVHGFAYPSGHVAAITLFCGYLVVRIFERTPSTHWRGLASLAAMLAVAAVSASRVYLGAHLPSDALAAVLLGVTWLGLCQHAARLLALTRGAASEGLPCAPKPS